MPSVGIASNSTTECRFERIDAQERPAMPLPMMRCVVFLQIEKWKLKKKTFFFVEND
jgi:hypothetical protein